MTLEDRKLLDSMVDAIIQDVLYQFNFDNENQAIKLIHESLTRQEKVIKK